MVGLCAGIAPALGMAMTDVSDAYRQDAGTDFALGSVFSLTSSILGAHFAPFAALGALASLLQLVTMILFPDTALDHAGAAQPATAGLLSA
jgi:hypothetical protein